MSKHIQEVSIIEYNNIMHLVYAYNVVLISTSQQKLKWMSETLETATSKFDQINENKIKYLPIGWLVIYCWLRQLQSTKNTVGYTNLNT